jgi:hypothetical protein
MTTGLGARSGVNQSISSLESTQAFALLKSVTHIYIYTIKQQMNHIVLSNWGEGIVISPSALPAFHRLPA